MRRHSVPHADVDLPKFVMPTISKEAIFASVSSMPHATFTSAVDYGLPANTLAVVDTATFIAPINATVTPTNTAVAPAVKHEEAEDSAVDASVTTNTGKGKKGKGKAKAVKKEVKEDEDEEEVEGGWASKLGRRKLKHWVHLRFLQHIGDEDVCQIRHRDARNMLIE